MFPTSFIEQNGELIADYGQRSIGRITSVDASLWWPVLCWLYVRRSKDWEFGASQKVQRGFSFCWILFCIPASRGRRCCSYQTAPS